MQPHGADAKILKCKDAMDIIERKFDSPKAEVVDLYEQVKAIARQHGMLLTEKINSKYMYVSPCNRYGDGVVPCDVTDLIIKILGNGFRHEHLLMPTCAEVPPVGTAEYLKIKGFNDKIMADSAGQLPFYDDGDGKYQSYTCGHTSQGLRCIIHGTNVPETNPERFSDISQDGKISLQRLQQFQPTYADAAVNGITWDIFKWQFIEAFPFVPDLVQEAGNAGQAAAKCESRLEIMLKIAQYAKSLKQKLELNPNETFPWDKVRRQAGRGAVFKHEIDHMVDYVKEMSGGLDNPVFLHELRDFNRHLARATIVKSDVAAAVATCKIAKEGSGVLFKLACIKAMHGPSDKYRKGDEQTLLKLSDVNVLQNERKAQIALQGDELLQKIRKLAIDFEIDPSSARWSNIVGLADVRVAHFVFNKPDESRGVYKQITDIAVDAWKAMAASTGNNNVRCPWKAKAVAHAPQCASSVSSTGVKTFDQRGEWVNVSETLAVKGFKVGVTVYNRQEGDESVYEIKAIDGQNVKMQTGDVERTIDAEDFMRNKFAIYDIKKEVIDQFDQFSPLNCMDYHWGVEEARIKIALDEVYSQHSACLKHITAIHSPIKYKAVSVKKEFKKDAIGLVPLTTTISLKKATDEINIGNVCLRKYTDPAKHTDYNVALMAAGGLRLKREEGGTGIGGLKRVPDQYGVPFWLVGVCTAKEKPNLAVTFVTATNGIKVPILKNTVELKSGDRLRMSEDTAKALARKVALSDATPAKPAKKKAKTQ